MGRPPKQCPVSVERLREMYETERLGVRQLSEVLGTSMMTLQRWMDDAGIPRRREGWDNPNRIECPISRQELERLYVNERKSTLEIARVFGVSRWMVNRWMKDFGLARRSDAEGSRVWFENHPEAHVAPWKATRASSAVRSEKGRVHLTCWQCRRPVSRIRSDVSPEQLQGKKPIFDTHACASKYRRENPTRRAWVDRPCAQCGKPVHRLSSDVKGDQVFCTKRCAMIYRSLQWKRDGRAWPRHSEATKERMRTTHQSLWSGLSEEERQARTAQMFTAEALERRDDHRERYWSARRIEIRKRDQARARRRWAKRNYAKIKADPERYRALLVRMREYQTKRKLAAFQADIAVLSERNAG